MPAMLSREEYQAFKSKFLRQLFIGLVITTILTIVLVGLFAYFQGVEMGAHGWIAMIVGIVLSFALGGTLTAVMVLGRRAGGDEAAGEIDWE